MKSVEKHFPMRKVWTSGGLQSTDAGKGPSLLAPMAALVEATWRVASRTDTKTNKDEFRSLSFFAERE